MRPRKIIFLINPVSGTGGKEKLISRIERICRTYNIHSEIQFSNAAADYAQLREKISREKTDVVAICGGDGTVGKAIGALYDLPVAFGIIPAGSGNGLALSAGIPMNSETAVRLACTGTAAPTDAFTFNGRFGCLACGLGFDATVAHEFATKKSRGLKTYLLLTAKTLFTSKAYPFSIDTGNGASDLNAFFISVLNGNQYGNQIKIAPRAQLSDGKLDVVVAEKMNKLAFTLRMLKQLVTARLEEKDKIESTKKQIRYFQSDNIRIINKGMAVMHIDGEPLAAEPILYIAVIKNAYRLIRPE
jgi:YegS/Rv2252/BmrU family lipid kinase